MRGQEADCMETRETKSPIKNLPVRQPGQSIRERIEAVFDDKLFPYFMAAVLACFLAVMEWCGTWFKPPKMPWVWTALAALTVLLLWRKFLAVRAEIKALRLGQIGEEAVGQFLDEKLRPMGCHVLHDIPADGFNVDHVVVGPTGAFSVETKTHSKPAKGPCIVTSDGDKVTVDGHTPDRDPIVQAKAEARWLSELLVQSTGRRFFVQPIVLYPGWFVEQKAPAMDVWVLNENVAPTFIKNSRNTLSAEDISLVIFHLKRYVIARGKEKQ